MYARLGVASSVLVHFCQKYFCWYRDTIFILLNYLYLDLYIPYILSLCCTIGASLLLSKVPLLVPRYSLYLYILSFSSLYIIFVLHHRCYCTFAQRTSAGTEIPGSRKFYDQQLNFRKSLCLISGPHQLEPAILQIPKKIIRIFHQKIMENFKMTNVFFIISILLLLPFVEDFD